jgi:hypothetical protein
MREITFVLDKTQESIVNDAVDGTRYSPEQWLSRRVESLINSQRTANLAKQLRSFAQQTKTLMRWDSQLNVEDCIIKFGISDKVTEYGGLGAFFKLMNSDYSQDRIHSNKPVFVPAEKK